MYFFLRKSWYKQEKNPPSKPLSVFWKNEGLMFEIDFTAQKPVYSLGFSLQNGIDFDLIGSLLVELCPKYCPKLGPNLQYWKPVCTKGPTL